MKFSTIITSYNYAEYLPQAIESAINQVDVENEIIVVDDGSTDHSFETAKWYEDKYEKVSCIVKENGGQASAFNVGYISATGDILAFLDADDFWYPHKLKTVQKFHKEWGIVRHNLLINGSVPYAFLKSGEGQQEQLYKYGCSGPGPTSGLSLSRWVADLIFPFPEYELRICADTYLKYAALLHSDAWTIDDSLGYYRSHEHNNYFQKENYEAYMKRIIEIVNQYAESIGQTKIPYTDKSFADARVNSMNLPPGQTYVVYGTGKAGRYIPENKKFIENECLGFIDSDPQKWGAEINGIRIYSPDRLENFVKSGAKIVIASMYCGEIMCNLELRGFREGEHILIPRI